jgi:hypothetical protein
MMTPDALPEDMPGLRAAALALLAERDELLRRIVSLRCGPPFGARRDEGRFFFWR